jgi:small-conductance mechanosensitive channel
MKIQITKLFSILWLLGLAACQPKSASDNESNLKPADREYVQILKRLESAGRRYRAAVDLQGYASSALERSLAEEHLDLARQILKKEFEMARRQSKESDNFAPEQKETDVTPEQRQYDKAAADVWKLYSDVETAKKKLDSAHQSLKRAATPESFRHAQQAAIEAQQEVDIANKKLDLAGSNLDIEDYRRKKSSTTRVDVRTLEERLNLLEQELTTPGAKPSPAVSTSFPADSYRSNSGAGASAGLVANFQIFFSRQEKLRILERSLRGAQNFQAKCKQSIAQNTQQLEQIQGRHAELNRKTQEAYSQAYEQLKKGGSKETVSNLLKEADHQLAQSARFDKEKDFLKWMLDAQRTQSALAQEDSDKLDSWRSQALDDRGQILIRISSRLGMILGLIAFILVIAHYLKKIPYKFTKEEKNVYYFRKLIGFCSSLLIFIIVLLNFISDFGSLSAMLGLAGAGLAIALQDPIVSLVGWFRIIGKYGISVGDRVEINNVKGDVVDIGLLRIAVLEVGNSANAEQSTGRMVFFPNSFIFKSHFFNYSTATPFIWDEIHLTVTLESNWLRAREIVEALARQVSAEMVEKARASQEQVSRRFHIDLGTLTPYVFVSIASNGVNLVLRYLTEIHRRHMTHDQICREILEAFVQEPNLYLVSPARISAVPAPPSQGMPEGSEMK